MDIEEEEDDDETMRDEDVGIQEVEAEQVEGPDDGELEMPAAEDWDTRVLRNHDRYLVPIIDMMIGDPAKSHVYAENKRYFARNTTFNNVRTFNVNHELLVNLMHRPDSRRRLISAIQQFGKETIDWLVIILRFPGSRPEEYPLHIARTACLAELMRAFSLCHKLRKVSWMFYGDIDAEITELFATVMSRLRPQIKEVVLFAERRHIPLNMLRSLSCLSNLESLDFDNIDAETLRFSFPRLLHATKLKRLGLGYSGLGTTTPTISSEVEAELVARLLALNKLETFKLSDIGLASVAVCQTFVESVVNSTNIKVLTFKRLHIAAQGMNEFYMQFTRRLPEMKNLESLSLYGGLPPMNDADETLQLLILRGAALAPKLIELILPNCYWSRALVDSLVTYISTSSTLRKLTICGSWVPDRPTDLPRLGPALELCNLESLTLEHVTAEELWTIALGIAKNRSIKELSMPFSIKMSFVRMTEIVHTLRLNPTLKSLCCESMLTYEDTRDIVLACASEVTPEAFKRLIDAISTNVELETIELEPYSSHHNEVRRAISVFTRLNKEGRRCIQHPEAPDFREKTFRLMETVNDSTDCLFIFLHDIPILFWR